MAELKLEHIKKTYDNNNTVVKDFNLHVTDKEFIVFVGPSDVVNQQHYEWLLD